MSFFRALFQKIRSLFLAIFRIFRKVLCCRRQQQESQMILPITIHKPSHVGQCQKEVTEEWQAWDNSEFSMVTKSDAVTINMDQQKSTSGTETLSAPEEEDFFKDMVPQFRKPKKVIVKSLEQNQNPRGRMLNRLAMNLDSVSSPGPELGLLEDNPTNWEVEENSDELWDPDSLIKEKKIAEREKRIAEHQRRKLEKENLRACRKSVPLNKINNSLTDSRDKTKYS